MDNNDSNNLKPTPTGGLKLMTVFIAVLALHVVVIGGFTAYHLMSGSSSDADLATDKSHKGMKMLPDGAVAMDAPLPDSQADKNAASASPTAENNAAPTTEATASNEPASAPSMPAPATATETPSAPEKTVETATTVQPLVTGPVISPVQPPAPATTASTPAPAAPAASMVPLTPETPATVAADTAAGTPYVVKSHDSLAKIARHNHTSVAKLKAANNLNSNMLHIGQKLIIPASEVAESAPATDAGENSNTPIGAIPAPAPPATTATVAATPKSAPAAKVASVTKSTKVTSHTYTVMKGDTLTKIAHKFKTTPNAIMTANAITDPAKLKIGKQLHIPSSHETQSASAAPVSTPAKPTQEKTPSDAKAQLANFIQ